MIKLKEMVTGMPKEGDHRPYMVFFNNIHTQDRKYIKRWHVREDGDDVLIFIYLSLIGQGMMESLLKFVEQNEGMYRIYPDDYYCCVEMRVKKKKFLKYE